MSLDLGIMSGFQGKRCKRWTCSEGIPAMSSIRKCNGQYLEQYLRIIGEVTEKTQGPAAATCAILPRVFLDESPGPRFVYLGRSNTDPLMNGKHTLQHLCLKGTSNSNSMTAFRV